MKKLVSFVVFFVVVTISYSQWIPVNNGFPESIYVNNLTIKNNLIFAGTDYFGVFVSSNFGEKWTQTNNGLDIDSDSLPKIRLLKAQGVNIWLCKAHRVVNSKGSFLPFDIYVSTNEGETWVLKNSNLPLFNGDTYVYNFEIFGDSVIVLDPANGIYLSTNEGDSWERILSPMLAQDIYIDNKLIYLYTNEFRLVRSTNGGTSWDTIREQSIFNFFKVKGDTLFIGGWGEGMLRSTDYGDNWEKINSGLTMPDVRSYLVKDDIIFIGTAALDGPEGGVYYSTNGGDLWIQKSEGLTNLWVRDLATIGDYIFAATQKDGVFRAKISDIITSVNDNDPMNSNLIYPNPANDFINISPYSGWNYEIYDLLGNNMQSGFIDSDKINVASFLPGFYTIRFSNATKTEVRKFIKQ
ncbi:MAG TPA: T9SS type A sorting domain-containing protein [Candidatus Kapabacteria bacterium]|nr:T9SS type A sorting domain-containing protein [Candidatus Kapabacteria bacterium]